MFALQRSAPSPLLHPELELARDIVASKNQHSGAVLRQACEYLLCNGDTADQAAGVERLRDLSRAPRKDNPRAPRKDNLRAIVWGCMGAFVAAFWMLIGIPALARIIQWGGQIVAGWL